jgi:hypothetical protein
MKHARYIVMGGKVHKEHLFPSQLYLTLFIGSSQSNMLSPFDLFTLNSTNIFQSELFSSGYSYLFPRFPHVFKQIFRLRYKWLSVFGEYVESI